MNKQLLHALSIVENIEIEVARLILYAYAMEKITLEEAQELSHAHGIAYPDDFWE